MAWLKIVTLVAFHFLQVVLAPKWPEPPTTTLDDLDIPAPKEGRIIPRVFGWAKIKGMGVVYSGNFFKQKILSKSSKK